MTQTATFGGGCFWCTEAIFQRLKGVASVTSGYAGGDENSSTYEKVSTGNTNHAEAIQIQFDDGQIKYSDLLEIFFATHDPTTVDRQGGDIGSQYRSVIFYHNDEQKKAAESVKLKIAGAVTQISPFEKFFKAEEYHQNYYNNNKDKPYCKLIINPKLEKLEKKFAKMLK